MASRSSAGSTSAPRPSIGAVSTRIPALNPQRPATDEKGGFGRPSAFSEGASPMRNYVQPGKTITLTAPYAVASGDGLLVGAIFGVAAGIAALGEPVETALVGVFDLKKVGSQAWAVGDKIYWDNTAKEATKTTTGNTLIGVATEAVGGGSGDTVGRVRLNGSF